MLWHGLQTVFEKDLSMSADKPAIPGDRSLGLLASTFSCLVDVRQRSDPFLDVLRMRGLQCRKRLAETAPHVLNHAVGLIIGSSMLRRPLHYAPRALCRQAGRRSMPGAVHSR
jgi:hypothetical protein